MLTPFFASHGLSQSLERRLILPSGLTDGSAYHELEDLILALARRLYGGDVLVGDPCRLPGDLVDQRAQRLGEPCVLEGGAPISARRPAVSLEDPGDYCLVRHALSVFSSHYIQLHSYYSCDCSAVSICQKRKRSIVKKGISVLQRRPCQIH